MLKPSQAIARQMWQEGSISRGDRWGHHNAPQS